MAKIKLNNLEYFTNKIAASLPIDAEHVKEEFKDNLKPLLQSVFEKFEIVSREEFEIQKEILRIVNTISGSSLRVVPPIVQYLITGNESQITSRLI